MKRIVVVSTGGTIASRWQGSGYAAEAVGDDILAEAPTPEDVVVSEVVDLFTVNSARLTTAQQLILLHTVHAILADPEVDGVVVTHGTDTLEESAFLLDLYHRDPRPVVFTGAQRALDMPKSDAGSNLHDALLTAANVAGLGVLVVFDGKIHAARGTVKTQTLALDAFGNPSGAPLGRVGFGQVMITGQLPERPEPLPLPAADVTVPRVDVVAHHVDGDALFLDTALAAGAEGIVLVGTGAGNATPEITESVRRAVDCGVLVAVSSRVAAGPVTALYTGGGAVDLVEAGAVLTGELRLGQSRIAVLAAVLSSADPGERVGTLRRLLGAGAPVRVELGTEVGPEVRTAVVV